MFIGRNAVTYTLISMAPFIFEMQSNILSPQCTIYTEKV